MIRLVLSCSRKAFLLSTCVLPPMMTPVCALGQEAADTPPQAGRPAPLETIVVTAERRANSVQKTPLAVTAVSAATLDKTVSTQISDLNARVPGLEITKASGFENLVTIRGVGSETPENSLVTSPGVAEFIDGVYIANTISIDQTLFDIDRVEVLRGPQGALYGQSATGGAINLITKQPQLGAFGGSADVSIGNDNLFRERAEVNIPVGDTIAVRLSAQKFDHDGFGTDTVLANNDLDDAHDQSFKAAVLWKPTQDFSATLTGMWYSADQNGAEQKNILDPQPDPRKFEQDYPSEFNLHTQLYHLNLQYDLDGFSIRSISGYQDLNHQQQEDGSRSTFALLGRYDDIAAWNTKLKNITEEFDVVSAPGSRLDWVVGAFFLNQSSHQFVAEFECTPSGFAPPCHAPTPAQLAVPPGLEDGPYPGNLDYGNEDSVQRRSYAVFGQATYHILPDLRVTVGGRFNYDFYDSDSFNFSAFGTGRLPVSYDDHVGTYRFALDYDLTPDNLLYVSAARGYKPGGTNGTANDALPPSENVLQDVFSPETNTTFEVGSKNTFLDHRLLLNAAAYFSFYRDMQYIEDDPTPFDSGVSNIPSIHAAGFELEGTYLALGDRLRINATLALETASVQGDYRVIDSTILNQIENLSVPPNPCAYGGIYTNSAACSKLVVASATDIRGRTPPGTPRQAGSANIAYTFDVPYGTLTPRADFVFRGSEYERVFNVPGLDRINSYGVLNLNLLYVPARTNWTVQLTATNITDVAGVNSRYTDPYGSGQTSVQYIPPFQIVGEVSYRF